jgi:hypothetical protein
LDELRGVTEPIIARAPPDAPYAFDEAFAAAFAAAHQVRFYAAQQPFEAARQILNTAWEPTSEVLGLTIMEQGRALKFRKSAPPRSFITWCPLIERRISYVNVVAELKERGYNLPVPMLERVREALKANSTTTPFSQL